MRKLIEVSVVGGVAALFAYMGYHSHDPMATLLFGMGAGHFGYQAIKILEG